MTQVQAETLGVADFDTTNGVAVLMPLNDMLELATDILKIQNFNACVLVYTTPMTEFVASAATASHF